MKCLLSIIVVLSVVGLLAACSVFAGIQAEASALDAPPRVLIAGDSTASSYPAERAPQTGWGQAFPYFVNDGVVVVNRAVSGRSTKSFIEEGKWASLLAAVRRGDIVLISFGHNDSRDDAPERYAEPAGAFRENLVRFANDVAEKRRNARYPLFCREAPVGRSCDG